MISSFSYFFTNLLSHLHLFYRIESKQTTEIYKLLSFLQPTIFNSSVLSLLFFGALHTKKTCRAFYFWDWTSTEQGQKKVVGKTMKNY